MAKGKKQGQSSARARNYAFLVYPDSAPSDWIDRLDSLHVQSLISPLHDRDLTEAGTPKKPHWHVMVMYPGMKSFGQADRLRELIGGVGLEVIESTVGYARYLCHMDNPEKAQYEPTEVRELGGASYFQMIERLTDVDRALQEMARYIRENNVRYYGRLFDYCVAERPDWFGPLMKRHKQVMAYIKSVSFEADELKRRPSRGQDPCVTVDPETGEIIYGDAKQ